MIVTALSFIEVGDTVLVDIMNKTVQKADGEKVNGIALKRIVKNATAEYVEHGDTADIAYLMPRDYVYYG
jgi:hypothetical protein